MACAGIAGAAGPLEPARGHFSDQEGRSSATKKEDELTNWRELPRCRFAFRSPIPSLIPLRLSGPIWPRFARYRHYADGERGTVLVNEERKALLRVREVA